MIAVLVLGLGILLLMIIAFRTRENSWTIDTFFLAGRNLGISPTANVFWGTSFSLANGIFYFVAIGYYFGLSVIWFQIPWMLAIWYLIWHLPQIMRETDRFTLHGFIGDFIGGRARTYASLVTLFALMGIFAFEVNVSVEIILSSARLEVANLLPIATVFLALFCAAYCDIGGFAGTARTDTWQNRFGLIAVLILVLFIFSGKYDIDQSKLQLDSIAESFFSIDNIPLLFGLGVLSFASVANIVDMSNWQTISANSLADEKQIRSLRWAMFRSSIYIIFVPAVLGSFIGYVHQGVEITDTEIVPTLVNSVSNAAGDFSGLALGLILLGFASAALSTADSTLLASSQALSWDLKDRNAVSRFAKADLPPLEQRTLLKRVRLRLYGLAMVAVLIFVVLRQLLGDETVFVLQFIIGAMTIPLAPTIIIGLFFRKRQKQLSELGKFLLHLSIVGGFVSALLVFGVFLTRGGDFNAYAWTSLATAIVSWTLAILALCAHTFQKKG